MVKMIGRLLRNRNVIMFLALVLGLVWAYPARFMGDLVLPALGLIMTLSTMGISMVSLTSFRPSMRAAVAGVAMCYLVQAGVLLALNQLFISNQEFRTGFVVLATVPPAVAVIPFTLFVGGDMAFSLMGTVGAYLAALGIAPVMALAFLGSGFMDPVKLLVILLELIVAPIILSQVLSRTGLSSKLEKARGPMTNWSFFLIVYTMTGLNRDGIISQPSSVVVIIALAVASTFVLGWVIEKAALLLGTNRQITASLVLLGTFKNYGLAGGLSLYFFNEQVALPATIASAVSILYIIFLEMVHKARGRLLS
jgi:BASS family bile acid:Na+ symporter